MISNATELEVAFGNLRACEDALEQLRADLQRSNPSLFPAVSGTYLHRIQALHEDIFAYLREHPAEAPLKVRLSGAAVRAGTVRVGLLAKLLEALQAALLHEGRAVSSAEPGGAGQKRTVSLRALLGLNLVATHTGSFVLAMDLAPRQLALFEEYDLAERAVTRLIDHVAELQRDQEEFSGGKSLLRALDKLATFIQPRKLDAVEIQYRRDTVTREATMTPAARKTVDRLLGRPREGEETIRGLLVSIDIEKNKCHLHPEGEGHVACDYTEDIEDDLILAVKKKVEVGGMMRTAPDRPDRRLITEIRRFRLVDSEEDE
jgi:hypothetical protein